MSGSRPPFLHTVSQIQGHQRTISLLPRRRARRELRDQFLRAAGEVETESTELLLWATTQLLTTPYRVGVFVFDRLSATNPPISNKTRTPKPWNGRSPTESAAAVQCLFFIAISES